MTFELLLNELVSPSLQRPTHIRYTIDDVTNRMKSHMMGNPNEILKFGDFVVDKFELKAFEG